MAEIDAPLLEGLKVALAKYQESWTVEFAASGQEALTRLERESFDILVTDMKMPDMSGVELLNEAARRHPRTLRFAISGQADSDSILKSVIPSHRTLYQPFEPGFLADSLAEALMNRDFLLDEGLQEIVSQIQTLPSLPTLYTELMGEMRNAEPSMKKIGEIIGRDIGFCTKILRIVNSAYYGVGRYVSNPAQAVSLMGLKTLQSLALMLGIFAQIEANAYQNELFTLKTLQDHSLAVGERARSFAKTMRIETEERDRIYLAGLLHDIGWLILASSLPQKVRKAKAAISEDDADCYPYEREAMGATHADLGAYLLNLWGFPKSVADMVACHHEPRKIAHADAKSILAVHAADALSFEGREDPSRLFGGRLDLDALEANGLMAEFESWKAKQSDVNMDEAEESRKVSASRR
jgi:putative nucleotidyltransferase with HDIG domain